MKTHRQTYTAAGNITENRFYAGDYELFTKTTNGTLDTERETLHISDDKQKVALIDYDTQNQTTTIRYQLTNQLDSAALELDENADIISYEEYHPFGTTSYRSGRSETEVSLKRYKFQMKEKDNETGLHYHGARYYAPWIGRWTAVDPMAEERKWVSPYNFVQNNPINRVDLDGALDTWYTDKEGNILMQTDDGSNDVVTVSDDKIEDFEYFAESYENSPGMKGFYECKDWNDHWKSEFGLADKQLSDRQIAHLGMLNSDWSRENAVEFWLTPTAENALAASFSEALSQWTNPELVITGLSAGATSYPTVLSGYKRGTAFSGIYNIETRQMVMAPSLSGRNAVAGTIPKGWVTQYGGHAKLVKMTAGKAAYRAGEGAKEWVAFTGKAKNSQHFQVFSWRSRGVNTYYFGDLNASSMFSKQIESMLKKNYGLQRTSIKITKK